MKKCRRADFGNALVCGVLRLLRVRGRENNGQLSTPRANEAPHIYIYSSPNCDSTKCAANCRNSLSSYILPYRYTTSDVYCIVYSFRGDRSCVKLCVSSVYIQKKKKCLFIYAECVKRNIPRAGTNRNFATSYHFVSIIAPFQNQ